MRNPFNLLFELHIIIFPLPLQSEIHKLNTDHNHILPFARLRKIATIQDDSTSFWIQIWQTKYQSLLKQMTINQLILDHFLLQSTLPK